MSKKKYNDYIQDAPAPPEPESQALPKEQAEAIAELYRSAKSMTFFVKPMQSSLPSKSP